MAEQIRGLFGIDLPPGGLDRLRLAMQRDSPQPSWLTWMPWTATAMLLLVTAVPMLADAVRTSRAGEEATARIVESVLEQEGTSLTALPASRADVRVFVARLSTADSAAAQPATPPDR